MTATITPATETNRALGRHFFEEQDRLRGGPALELCAPSYRAHLGGNPAMDRAAHEGFALGFYGAFPDLHHVIEHVVATEDAVVVRFVLHGTNSGSLFGMPATGRAATIACIAMLFVENGKVVTLKAVFDEAGMLRQLGVLPGG